MELERKSNERRKEDERLSAQNGNVGIKSGVQLANFAVDQFQVISLLNQVPAANGGTLHPSGPRRAKDPRNGFCDAELHKSIFDFQKANSATLGVIDGWISPTGPTLKLLKAMAAGKGLTTPSGGVDQQTQELLRQLQIVVTDGRQLLQLPHVNLVPLALRERLRLLVGQLERDLDLARKGRPQGNAPVKNAVPLAGVAIIAVILAAAAVIVGLFLNPAFRKAAQVTTDEVLRGIDIRIGEFNRLLTEIQISAFSNVVSGVVAVRNAVNDLKKRVSSCGPKFALFQSASEPLILTFRTQGEQSLLEALMRKWIDALSALLFCLQENGVSPTEILKILFILHSPLSALNITLFDAISKLFLKGFFPAANLLKR